MNQIQSERIFAKLRFCSSSTFSDFETKYWMVDINNKKQILLDYFDKNIKFSFTIIVTLMAISWVSLLHNWNLNIMLINSNNCQFYSLYDKLYFWK